jgi:branched-chain amino acid transport system permease protein
MKKYFINISGLIALLLFLILLPLFDQSPYHLDLLITMIMNGLLATTFIILLRTGSISLAIAAFWGIGAYTSAVLSTKLHLAVWLCLPATALLTGLLAFILGFALIKNSGFSFVMMTAVIGTLFTILIGNISFLGGYNGISNIPPPEAIRLPILPPIDFSEKEHWYYLILILFIIIVLIVSAFNKAWTGRAWTAIGMNRLLAGALGINTFRYKMSAFVLTSAIIGLLGSFHAHYMTFIIPNSYGIWQVIYIQMYAILGGAGYAIAGPLIGSAIITLFPEFVRQLQNMGQMMVGLLLIIVIVVLPDGLLSLPKRFSGVRIRFFKIVRIIKSKFTRVERREV